MIALRLGGAALTFLRARQLLEAAVKLLCLPAPLHGFNHHFPVQVGCQLIGYRPLNATVRGG